VDSKSRREIGKKRARAKIFLDSCPLFEFSTANFYSTSSSSPLDAFAFLLVERKEDFLLDMTTSLSHSLSLVLNSGGQHPVLYRGHYFRQVRGGRRAGARRSGLCGRHDHGGGLIRRKIPPPVLIDESILCCLRIRLQDFFGEAHPRFVLSAPSHSVLLSLNGASSFSPSFSRSYYQFSR